MSSRTQDRLAERRRASMREAIAQAVLSTDRVVIEHRLAGALGVGIVRDGATSYITDPAALAFGMPLGEYGILAVPMELVEALSAAIPPLRYIGMTTNPCACLREWDYDYRWDYDEPWQPFDWTWYDLPPKQAEAVPAENSAQNHPEREPSWLTRLFGLTK